MNTPSNQQKNHGPNASERRVIGFLIAKVVVFIAIPLLAAAIAVYVML